ncbi:YqhG family protein [Priestia megaterium]
MQQTDIHQFLKRYFLANNCSIVTETPSYLTVQLTIELDKELMNRPFYWHYIEKTGGEANPASLTFITDPAFEDDSVQGERIHFGSPRLHQIFASTQKLGGFIHLYEQVSSAQPTNQPLHPWLALNIKVSYKCDRKKDELLSLGINLINGQIVESFHELIINQNLSSKISDYCFTLSPFIKPKSAISRLTSYVTDYVKTQPTEWAEKAQERWYEDLALLDHFYETAEELPEIYMTEKTALQELYEPTILFKFINGGLFYISPETMSRQFNKTQAG